MKRKQTQYNCRQPELYTVSAMAWNSCLNNLSRFQEWSTLYTDDYIQAQLLAVEAAAALPNALVRNSREVSLRIQLMECAKENLYNWQRLKLYITRAWSEPFATNAIKAAGSAYYEKAANNSWSKMQSLMNAGVYFTAQNTEKLIANGNAPADFFTSFGTAAKRLIGLLDDYYQIENENCIAAETKVDANNAIYTELIKMLRDAKLIFNKDAALKKQFVFNTLVQKINGPQAAALPQVVSIDTCIPIDNEATVNAATITKNEAAEMFVMPVYETIADGQKVA